MSRPSKGDAMKALAKLGVKSDKDAKEAGYYNREAMIDDIAKHYDRDGSSRISRNVSISPHLR